MALAKEQTSMWGPQSLIPYIVEKSRWNGPRNFVLLTGNSSGGFIPIGGECNDQ